MPRERRRSMPRMQASAAVTYWTAENSSADVQCARWPFLRRSDLRGGQRDGGRNDFWTDEPDVDAGAALAAHGLGDSGVRPERGADLAGSDRSGEQEALAQFAAEGLECGQNGLIKNELRPPRSNPMPSGLPTSRPVSAHQRALPLSLTVPVASGRALTTPGGQRLAERGVVPTAF